MKLQLALDLVDCQGAKAILSEVHDLIDIVEIGTPFLLKEGVRAITEIKSAYPSLEVLADVKIMDGGDYEARLVYNAGADIVTVLGAAASVTIQNVVKAARACRKQVLVDMIAVEPIEQRVMQIDQFDVDYICVHTGTDVQAQGKGPLDELQCVSAIVRNARIAVAGGINQETLPPILSYRPEIVIVGGAITAKADKRQAVLAIKEVMA
ncbi:3-hexulose-6-phosphate synthase [Candidatus Vecturithrix granuli]|uniref:3-hexulose-6-phosphate synthase n=1 Tax=Vecturithrix granuli TaxID=1499967 RepID=A0A081C300_VECG1|nr:3-hexulose-6-phosphate synthase [Candidatus Vecturithrix granuli]